MTWLFKKNVIIIQGVIMRELLKNYERITQKLWENYSKIMRELLKNYERITQKSSKNNDDMIIQMCVIIIQ
jgi:RNA processing factor Prp31